MTVFDLLLLIAAAFGAGALNTVAGGGSFLTFPALVFAGVPTIAANATSAVAVFPGYLSGALGFTSDIRQLPLHQTLFLLLISALGGVLGSLLLLISTPSVFTLVVPFLLGFATLLFAFGKIVSRWAEGHMQATGWQGRAAALLVCIYGGYFNGGLGIVLLALMAALGMRDINAMNGLKNGMSFVLSGASVLTLSFAGLVYWPQAIVMMIAATAGGYFGARAARRMSPRLVRFIVIATGAVMTLIFTWRI
ncbi:sulfite exporter TauE/SafE family protein [Roseovarius sp. ZX-A-9]|uniref:sulfite exporter TauE/SafE family protein n=1 Tax=Roseovarius sp. ZX-A-9 TaxID=3014783 RepID=UPI00232C3320|nr:sulfite exporter TauE/SafE family protein [Roseovarius sp. ZX-A-9]